MKTPTDLFQPPPHGGARLGLGEVVDADQSIPTWLAREAFTLALKKEAPGVMPSLVGEALSPFLDLVKLLTPMVAERRKGEVDVTYQCHIDRCAETCMSSQAWSVWSEVIAKWAEGWNLRARWIHIVAWDWLWEMIHGIDFEPLQEVLEAARADPPRVDGDDLLVPVAYRAPHGISPRMVDHILSPLLEAPDHSLLPTDRDEDDPHYWPLNVFFDDEDLLFDWNPAMETRADNESRAVEWFRKRYRTAQDVRIEEAQERYPHPSKARSFEHFCWLVQYQVLRVPYAEIARRACRSRQTVAEAVQDTAQLVRLQLREPDRPGRKRQSSTI